MLLMSFCQSASHKMFVITTEFPAEIGELIGNIVSMLVSQGSGNDAPYPSFGGN